jgi:D-glycero-alpha-D-manno-heptose 1-phosphate guanylyltransferase
MSADTAGAS